MPIKSQYVLKQNVLALLKARGHQRKELAFRCGYTKAWLSQILNKPAKYFRAQDLDVLADFFGLEVYQLFQPGISPLTERRKGGDRRKVADRRVSHSAEMLEPVMSWAQIQEYGSRLHGEESRQFFRKVKSWIDAGLGTQRGIAVQPDPQKTPEKPAKQSSRLRAGRK